MNFLKLLNKEATTNESIRNIVIIALFFSFGSLLASQYGVHFNLSDSFKEKIFIVTKNPNLAKIGKYDYITALSPIENPYIPEGKKLIKQIICSEGDDLVVRGDEFYCNGQRIAIAKDKDSKDRPIKSFYFNGTIPKDHFFVLGNNPKSFDSRYFGFIERKNILGVGLWKF